MSTIIKNEDSLEHVWGGIGVQASSQYSMQEVDRIRLLSDSSFLADVNNELAIINDGTNDLNPEQGLLFLKKQLTTVYETVQFSPAVGIHAPELVSVNDNSPVHGYSFDIGDEIFALTHFCNLILNDVYLQLHLIVNNSTSDRWIQFDFNLLSTTGILDKALDSAGTIISTGAVQIPTTPYLVFNTKISVPISLFENGEDNLFIRVKRTTPVGKTGPTNNPIVVRMDKIHKQKLDI